MESLPAPPPVCRLLLALASTAGDGSLRTVLDTLAHSTRLELTVLYVEDIDMLGAAALPFTREIGLVSGIAREFGPLALERTLRAQATAAELHVRRLAAELRAAFSFEVSRGRMGEEVTRRADQADVVLVASRRAAVPAVRRARVAVWIDEVSTTALRALDTGAGIARQRHLPLIVLRPRTMATAANDPDAWIRGHLERAHVPARIVDLEPGQAPGHAVPLQGDDVLVTSAGLFGRTGIANVDAPTVSRCTLVLLR